MNTGSVIERTMTAVERLQHIIDMQARIVAVQFERINDLCKEVSFNRGMCDAQQKLLDELRE